MKKIITLLLTATLTMTALAGCSTSSNNADNTASSTSATTQETESTKTEQTKTEKALALIDTFATGDTDIAEHWDVMETIADKSTWQNQNGKF